MQKGWINTCRLLKRYPIKVDAVNQYGKTPLCLAAEREEFFEIAKLLIILGADYQFKVKGKLPVLFIAVRSRNLPLCRLLVEDYAVDVNQAVKGVSPLFQAAQDGEF